MTAYKQHVLSDALQLWTAATPHTSIVTIMGCSVIEDWAHQPSLVLDAWVDLLDKGTEQYDKIALASAIESLGAQIQFSAADGYLLWTARCLKQDVATVYHYVYDMLYHATFPEDEILLWKKIAQSSVHEDMSDPSACSLIAAVQHMYPPEHPYYRQSLDVDMAWLTSIAPHTLRAQLLALKHRGMQLVVVGDIDESLHTTTLSSWQVPLPQAAHYVPPAMLPRVYTRQHVEIADKTSSDARIMQVLSLDKNHPDYWPLLVAVDALGGTFSARLMRTVRDVEGLTYGVNSKLYGLMQGLGGYFSTVITLAPCNVEKGIASTLHQIQLWQSSGLTEDELQARKEGLLGRHAVRSTSSMQIAAHMRHGLMYGFGVSYAEQYMQHIEKVTLAQVNAAIKTWIDLDAFVIVTAGTSAERIV